MAAAARLSPLASLALAWAGLAAAESAAPGAPPQVEAVYGLIGRVLGSKVHLDVREAFKLQLARADGNESRFEVHTSFLEGRRVQVRLVGTDGVALASAFRHYCFNYLNISVTWGYNQTGRHVPSSLAQPLPAVPAEGVVVTSPAKYRYYMNYCTTSYSFAFYGLDQWLEEVDWMAMHGINAPLATTGVEATLALAYGPSGLGLTEQELLDFFPGPAFLAWNRMANMDGPWSGPLTKAWRDRRAGLSARVFARMRELGMQPVLQGFSGHIPCALQRVFPEMKMAPRPHWNGFNSTCLLDPSDTAHFGRIAEAFYRAQEQLYGTSHLYAADQWNEMEPAPGSSADFLRAQSAAVYGAMAAFDPSAKWVMQAWFLVALSLCNAGQQSQCGRFWEQGATPRKGGGKDYPLVRAYLAGVPRGSLLMLDLEADLFPVYDLVEGFYGHEFLWLTIHNFGRKTGMYGDLAGASSGPARAAGTPSFRGIGLAPEGVHQNPVYYELIAEMGWRREAPNIAQEWVPQYALARYGPEVLSADVLEAWRLMTDATVGGVYTTSFDVSAAGTINGPASFALGGPSLTAGPPGHNATTECTVWGLLLRGAEAAGGELPTTLRYDLVDSTRQSLDNLLWDVGRVLEAAWRRRDAAGVLSAAAAWREVAEALDRVLNTDRNFMLGPWIADAVATAAQDGEQQRQLLEYNARNQITLWGPTTAYINDYARKMWGGLVASYYVRGRWGILLGAVEAAARNGSFPPLDPAAIGAATATFEVQWQTNFSESFPTSEQEDAVQVSSWAHSKFADPRLATRDFREVQGSGTPAADAGAELLAQPAWTRAEGTLAFLCALDAACEGFATDGRLLRRVPEAGVRCAPGVRLYKRRELRAEQLIFS